MYSITLTPGVIFGALAALVAACGIPSAVTGLVIRRLEKKMDEKAKREEEKDAALRQICTYLVGGVDAAISLGEATAHAMQLGHTNGDMEAALDYAKQVKHKQRDFLTEQGFHHIID